MKTAFRILLTTIVCWLPSLVFSQTSDPSVDPKAYYTDSKGFTQETTAIEGDDGQAPLAVSFRANPADMGDWTPSFEWHFRKDGTEGDLFVRYEEDTDYTFVESGTFHVVLKTFLQNGNLESELDSVDITVAIAESKLEMPNAFSPNNDGKNDLYQAKKDYRSIVSFHAIILNRWGQKLYEWDNPADGYGWDGKFHGHDVKEGVYFVHVEARGADGKEYKIRRDVNLLRGYTGKGTDTTTEGDQ